MRLYLSSHRLGTAPDELVSLLKGNTRIAVIANAADDIDPAKRSSRVERELGDLGEIGLDPDEVDLRDYFGEQSQLKSALDGFDAVWVLGGNVIVLRTAFHESGADVIVGDRLRRDSLVFAGYSAGPCILGPPLLWDEVVDQVPPGYPDQLVKTGMDLVPFAIAPHYGTEPGAAGATRVTDYYIENHIPFIALRDGQAIVIDGDGFRVVE